MHAAAAFGLIVAVLAVALGTSSPQIGVAEFSPAARNAIDTPPPTDPGSQAGARAARRRATTTTTVASTTGSTAPGQAGAAPTTRVSRTRQCVGNPPRQIDDPMSPACVATIFEGDNGGATAPGVTGTEIRVGVPIGFTCGGGDSKERPVRALFDYFNTHFELYGRRLVPVFVNGVGRTSLEARSTGADIAAQGIFGAVTGIQERCYGQASLPAELARRGIVTITRNASTWWTDRGFYDQYHPYAWSIYPSSEDRQVNLADFACRSLARRPASHAGDPALRMATRRFGIVRFGVETVPSTAMLSAGIQACTDEAPVQIDLTDSSPSADRQAAWARLRSSGVTTVICVCEGFDGINALDSSASINFLPEWIVTPMSLSVGEEARFQFQDAKSVASVIRVDAGPRLLPVSARPWFGALTEMVAASSTTPGLNISDTVMMAEWIYAQLLVMASGVQSAGPALTADSFAAALMATQFPNPGAGQAPYWQPSAGFGPGDHSFYDDYLVAWWSETAPAVDMLSSKPLGAWCYLEQGNRFGPGTYPTDADQRLFNADVPCR